MERLKLLSNYNHNLQKALLKRKVQGTSMFKSPSAFCILTEYKMRLMTHNGCPETGIFKKNYLLFLKLVIN